MVVFLTRENKAKRVRNYEDRHRAPISDVTFSSMSCNLFYLAPPPSPAFPHLFLMSWLSCRVISPDLVFPSRERIAPVRFPLLSRFLSFSLYDLASVRSSVQIRFSNQEREGAEERELSGIAGLMAMFARSFFCATGNSVPRFPRHGREAGKIACLGSMILGEKRGRCEREMKREKAKKRRRKKGRGWNDAQSFVHKGSSGEHNLQSVQKYFYYPLEINRKMRFLAKFANYISISMQVWYSENYKILINYVFITFMILIILEILFRILLFLNSGSWYFRKCRVARLIGKFWQF